MGEVIKSCCYCCCTCYQSGVCCASLCCLILPIVGLLLILAGIAFAIVLAFSMIHHDSSGNTVNRLVTVLSNLTTYAHSTTNETAAANATGIRDD